MDCPFCSNNQLKNFEVVIDITTHRSCTFNAGDMKKCINEEEPIGGEYWSISTAKCLKCGNELDDEDLEVLSKELKVNY